MHKQNPAQARILDTVTRIGNRIASEYSANNIDDAIRALREGYAKQFEDQHPAPKIEVTRGRVNEIKVYLDLPKIGTFKPTFQVTTIRKEP